MVEQRIDNPPDIIEQYKLFREREGFYRAIGIIGGSDGETLESYKEILVKSFELVKSNLGKVAIVSGGTKGGVPELALDIAKKVELPTIGIYPLEKEKYAVIEKINFAIAVPSQPLSNVTWGIETTTLTSIPDVFILIGGEWGTLTEVSMIMKRNKGLEKEGLAIIPIIAIKGSGKLADQLEKLANVFGGKECIFASNDPPEISEFLKQALK